MTEGAVVTDATHNELTVDGMAGALVTLAMSAATGRADELGVSVSVVVVDRQAHELGSLRQVGASWMTMGVARVKAITAAATQRDSGDLAALKERYPEMLDLWAQQLPVRPTSLPGGVLVRYDGHSIGAVGVSGASPEQDVDCADAARRAVLAAISPGDAS